MDMILTLFLFVFVFFYGAALGLINSILLGVYFLKLRSRRKKQTPPAKTIYFTQN